MAQNKTQKDFLMKTPLIDFSDHLQSASDDISHHVANIDTYIRVLCAIKLHEIGRFSNEELSKSLDGIFKNRSVLINTNSKKETKRAKVSLDKGQIVMWILEKITTFAIFLVSLLLAKWA